MIKKYSIFKVLFAVAVLFSLYFSVSSFALEQDIQQRIETHDSDIPHFSKPVTLLVGINHSELAYNETSILAGFELFSVPYRADIQSLVSQINPTQVIIKHPSGFVGLYSKEGQLIRGVKTLNAQTVDLPPGSFPPSIVQPHEAIPGYPEQIHTGSLTGTVPHGGLGYQGPPKGRGIWRHLLKLTTLTGLVPFQYPGYFNAYSTTETEKLFPSLILPQAPLAIGAAATLYDAKLDEAEYEHARTQPRDYKWQPVLEGY